MKLLEVRNLKTYFNTSKGQAKAVDGVSSIWITDSVWVLWENPAAARAPRPCPSAGFCQRRLYRRRRNCAGGRELHRAF